MNDHIEQKRHIAYHIFEKREIIAQELGLYLSGDQLSDWVCGEKYVTDDVQKKQYLKSKFAQLEKNIEGISDVLKDAERAVIRKGKFASVPCFKSQVNAACRAIKAMDKGKRFVHITGPFQIGKTGVFLVVSEILLKRWQDAGKVGRIVILAMNGQRDIEKQISDRITEYGYTASVKHWEDVSVTRCNKGKKQSEILKEILKNASEKDPVFIIADEAHWGTDVNSLFSKNVLKFMRDSIYSSAITVSATPYEMYCAVEVRNIFQEILIELCDGYVGPSHIAGIAFPTLDGYVERDVEIEESIPIELKYYDGHTVHSEKVEKLIDFLNDKKYLEESNVSRWFNCEAAEIAVQYMKFLGKVVVPHFGKYLKEPLQEKLPLNKNYCLVVVDTLTCSSTLPTSIHLGIDATSFKLGDSQATVTAMLQALYGRLCGYRKYSKLVTCPGMKQYVNQYKYGEGTASLHTRVKFGKSKEQEIVIVMPDKSKQSVIDCGFSHHNIKYIADEKFAKLQNLFDKYKKNVKYRRKEGNVETLATAIELTGVSKPSFMYRGIEKLDNLSTWGGGGAGFGIFWDKQQKNGEEVWGLYFYQSRDQGHGNNEQVTTNDSFWADKNSNLFTPATTNGKCA